MSETMKAVRYHEYGDSAKLAIETADRPAPKANEVLVKVAYAGVNPVDWKLRSGMLKDFMPVSFPAIPGADFSGVVAAAGAGVKDLPKGRKVFGVAGAAYAEYLVAAGAAVAGVPDNITLEEAASVPLGALTAWHTVEAANIQAGQTVVVVGAAGGVGLYAVQLSRQKGARVIGLASGANVAFVKSLGAEAVDYRGGAVSSLAGRADVVIDTVGGAALEDAYALVKKGGVLLTVAGAPSAEKAKALGITADRGGNKGPEPLGKIRALLESGRLKAGVGKVFPMREAGAAQDLSQSGHGRGRILLEIWPGGE